MRTALEILNSLDAASEPQVRSSVRLGQLEADLRHAEEMRNFWAAWWCDRERNAWENIIRLLKIAIKTKRGC
jgi:hypothetical protein